MSSPDNQNSRRKDSRPDNILHNDRNAHFLSLHSCFPLKKKMTKAWKRARIDCFSLANKHEAVLTQVSVMSLLQNSMYKFRVA